MSDDAVRRTRVGRRPEACTPGDAEIIGLMRLSDTDSGPAPKAGRPRLGAGVFVLAILACVALPAYLVGSAIGSLERPLHLVLYLLFLIAWVTLVAAVSSMVIARRSAARATKGYLSSLGLSVVQEPGGMITSPESGGRRLRMGGSYVIAGVRAGRQVETRTEVIGARSKTARRVITTRVGGSAPVLELHGGPDGWSGDPVPRQLGEFLAWIGPGRGTVEVRSGTGGVTVSRSFEGSSGAAGGVAGHDDLRDIFLAEQISALGD